MNRGFTLVELSIVLVIIGLVIAGVMFGADMVEDAEHRALFSQMEELDTASMAFINKYDGLPGDFEYSRAQAYGFSILGADDGIRSNGDGRIFSWHASFTCCIGLWVAGDQTLLATHLNEANMYASDSVVFGTVGNGRGVGPNNPYLLAEGLDDTGIWPFTYSDGNVWWGLFISPSATQGAQDLNNHVSTQNRLRPTMAKIIDNKFDDGMPNTGRIRATTIVSHNIHIEPAGTTNSSCVAGGADSDDYVVSADQQRCYLSIRSSAF